MGLFELFRQAGYLGEGWKTSGHPKASATGLSALCEVVLEDGTECRGAWSDNEKDWLLELDSDEGLDIVRWRLI